MKHYYYADKDKQHGPYTIEELQSKRLKKSTLVWTDGMQDWNTAESIKELKDILISEPPPLPKMNNELPITEPVQIKQKPNTDTNSKYDLTYTKESNATLVGVILLIVPIALKLSNIFSFETEEIYTSFAIGSLVIRIATTVWVVNIATRQNRNYTGWGLFSFFLPSIALIIIGQLNKNRLIIELDGNLTVNQQVDLLLEKANMFYSDNRYTECIEILNKIIELDCKNVDSIRLRALANYHLKKYDQAKNDFKTMVNENKYLNEAYYHLGNITIEYFDREAAVSYWLKAKEYQNEKAQIQLDFYHTYTAKYLLDNSQVNKKLNKKSELYICIRDEKYKSGLSEIDKNEKLETLTTEINVYKKGLHIILKKHFKTYNIAIAFYEIKNIKYYLNSNIIELNLIDEVLLRFTYDQSKHDKEITNKLCEKVKNTTSKKIEVISPR